MHTHSIQYISRKKSAKLSLHMVYSAVHLVYGIRV